MSNSGCEYVNSFSHLAGINVADSFRRRIEVIRNERDTSGDSREMDISTIKKNNVFNGTVCDYYFIYRRRMLPEYMFSTCPVLVIVMYERVPV